MSEFKKVPQTFQLADTFNVGNYFCLFLITYYWLAVADPGFYARVGQLNFRQYHRYCITTIKHNINMFSKDSHNITWFQSDWTRREDWIVIDRDYGLGSGGSRSLIRADDGSTERGVEKSCVHFTACLHGPGMWHFHFSSRQYVFL
jgi:hypothetical protein